MPSLDDLHYQALAAAINAHLTRAPPALADELFVCVGRLIAAKRSGRDARDAIEHVQATLATWREYERTRSDSERGSASGH